MRAVWLVRSRELAGRMRFWTSIVGYDPRDRSVSHRIYLVYVVIFFSLWGFAVLALLADLSAGMLSLVEGLQPSTASTIITATLLILDTTIRGYSAGKRSPFIFSDADAQLICQTPVDRRHVALVWCVGDCLPEGIAFSALAVVFRFAILQITESGGIVWSHLPGYVLAGLQTATIIIPLHLAFMSLVYALGAARLMEDIDRPQIRWVPVGVAIILGSLIIGNKQSLQVILWPILFPLVVSYGEGAWLSGLAMAVFLAGAGLWVLFLASLRLNLSRAAHESRFRWAASQVGWLGDSSLRQQDKIRQRLGIEHSASQLAGQSGYRSLIWKDWVTTLRALDFEKMIGWLGIFGLSMGVILAPDWGTRSCAFIFWSMMVGQRGTERLRNDLRVWTITRQMPFTGRETIAADLLTPVLGTVALTLLMGVITIGLGTPLQTGYIFIFPSVVLSVVLAAVVDILRQCRSDELLAGRAAGLGAGGTILGIILAGFPMFLFTWIASRLSMPGMVIIVLVSGLVVNLAISFLMWRLASAMYRRIK